MPPVLSTGRETVRAECALDPAVQTVHDDEASGRGCTVRTLHAQLVLQRRGRSRGLSGQPVEQPFGEDRLFTQLLGMPHEVPRAAS